MHQRTAGGAGRTWTAIALAAAAAGAGPATQPTALSAAQPSTRPTADLLAQVDAAYAALTSAEFDGRITAHLDVAGRVEDHAAPFTSAFAAPNRFRHDVPGDVTACSTGSHVYAALTGPNEYLTGEAPKARAAGIDWPANVGQLLSSQNPSLLLALVPSAREQLVHDSKAIVPVDAVSIDNVSCPTVRLDPVTADGPSVTLSFAPADHLLRRATFDLSASLKSHGAADVKAAMVTVDYTVVRPGATADADRFAYAPPAAAVLATAGPVAQGDAAPGASDDGPATALVGKPAPAFTLESLDGVKVSLADQKGKVVVLDMWATWCGPCVASLPHLDELYKGYQASSAPVAVFAVNLKEDADTVKPFVKRKGWSLPVLLDLDGDVAKAYLANAIPETVVIGKDGVVKKVFVGSGNEDGIKAAVEAELKR
jgi:thiol-disulfide isomerase/thioredoxin